MKNKNDDNKKLLFQQRIDYDDPLVTRSFCLRESTANKIEELMQRLNISKSELLRQAIMLFFGVVEGSRDLDKAVDSIKVQRALEYVKSALQVDTEI